MTAVADGAADACRTEHGTSATVTATQCVAIAKIPLGSRVLAGNPRPWEFDDSLPEPDRATWRVVTLVLLKDDLTTVEIQMLRPLAWIDRYGIEAGKSMQLHVPELGIARPAEIVSVGPCPAIAEGEGRVVTARFVTRDPGNVVRVSLANGGAIRATDVHPVWSVDREDWVPAGELATGERLDTLAGPVAVVGVERIGHHPTVYNLEVHGEHVYRVTEDGVLVHNAGPKDCLEGIAPNGDPVAGGGAHINNLSEAVRTAIQRFVDLKQTTVTVVGSRARGTAGPRSDFDYLIAGNSRVRQDARKMLPRGTAGGEIGTRGETGVDIFDQNIKRLDLSLPHIIFSPTPSR